MGSALLSADAPLYDDWKSKNARLGKDGIWVFEGDILIGDEDVLRAIYLERFHKNTPDLADQRFRSIAACEGPRDRKWNVGEKLDLTYCIGRFETLGLREMVILALDRATYEWERAGDVNYIHIADMSEEECNCLSETDFAVTDTNDIIDACTLDTYKTRARIRIREMLTDECGGLADCFSSPAKAAFPHSGITPQIRVHWTAAFSIIGFAPQPGDLLRHMRHELGHNLGLRHEHVRYIQGPDRCVESDDWRVLTSPDSASVMGYGPCRGIDGVAFSPDFISPLDRHGLSYLYNLPRSDAPSFTSAEVDDILWFIPSTGNYVLWRATPTLDPQDPIQFVETSTFCMGSNCDTNDFRFVHPIPANLSVSGLSDVIAHNPGPDPDFVHFHTPGGALDQDPASIQAQPFDLPLVGRFFGLDALEKVWWVRPGIQTDPRGKFSMQGTYNVSISPGDDYGSGNATDVFWRPIVGKWSNVGAGTPNSQVLWYSEATNAFQLSFLSEDGLSMESTSFSPSCLATTYNTIPLRGDFDGDTRPEIIWASSDSGLARFWREPTLQTTVANACNNPALVQTLPLQATSRHAKPFVGDFDGDGRDDVYWYNVDRFLNLDNDFIWTHLEDPQPEVRAPLLDGAPAQLSGTDLSPFVGDFNGDGCDDILWFSPDSDWDEVDSPQPTGGEETGNQTSTTATTGGPPPGTTGSTGPDTTGSPLGEGFQVRQGSHPGNSPLWRSKCDPLFTGFTLDPTPAVPSGGYPVGYDPRVAPRRAGL